MSNVPATPDRSGQIFVIEPVAADTLIPDPKNARVHTEKPIAKLAASIAKFGFTIRS